MRCKITYKREGKKRKYVKGLNGRDAEFENCEKARQFMRNHRFEYPEMRCEPMEVASADKKA